MTLDFWDTFNITIWVLHLLIDAGISISLLQIANRRQNKTALYLGLTGIMLFFTATAALYFFANGQLFAQTPFTIGISIGINSFSIVFLFRFMNQIFNKPHPTFLKRVTIFYLTFTAIIWILVVVYLLIPPSNQAEFGVATFPLFGLYAFAGLGGNFLSYLYMINLTAINIKKAEKGSIEYVGSVFIFWFGFFAVLSFSMMMVSFATFDEGPLLGFVWVFSTLSSILAYFSFIFPRKIRERKGELEPEIIVVSPFVAKHHAKFTWIYQAIALITTFYLNLKFVQLGIPDLGQNVLGVGLDTITTGMLSLGASGFISCILMGKYLTKHPITPEYKLWFNLLGSVGLGILVVISWFIDASGFIPWIIIMGLWFGAYTCIAYSLIFDFISPDWRGLNAGILTGIIYLIGASSMEAWTMSNFREQILYFIGIAVVIQALYIIIHPFDNNQIKTNVEAPIKHQITLGKVCLVLFLILFIDSFGFLRVVGNLDLLPLMWQGPQSIRLYIGIIHFISAILGGLLYKKTKPWMVAIIALCCFIIADFILGLTPSPENQPWIVYIFPLFYASAVSLYTVIFLSVLADISEKENSYKNISIGMAIFGWFASYFGTALSLAFIGTGTTPMVPFGTHLSIAALISMITLGIILFYKKSQKK